MTVASLDPTSTLSSSFIKHHQCSGNCNGHAFKLIYEGVADVALGVLDGAKRVIRAIGQIRMNVNCFGRALKLGVTVFSTIELAAGRPGIFTTVSERFLTTDEIIDTFQVFEQSRYFIGKEHVKGELQENIWNIIANAILLAAGVGGLVFLAGEMVMKGLAKVSSSIGGHAAYGIATQVFAVVGKVVGGLIGVGFLALGGDAVRRIVQTSKEILKAEADQENAKTDQEKAKIEQEKTKFVQNRRKAILDLIWCVTEVALKVLTVALCITNPWILCAAIAVSSLTGCITFLYRKSVEDRQEEAKKPSLV
ncbi:MAG: hypothetical protein K940chlam7_00049 [Chlamydiae bacterium]|nr:hypothetical protein [Chlamydiota bacterium]